MRRGKYYPLETSWLPFEMAPNNGSVMGYVTRKDTSKKFGLLEGGQSRYGTLFLRYRFTLRLTKEAALPNSAPPRGKNLIAIVGRSRVNLDVIFGRLGALALLTCSVGLPSLRRVKRTI